MHDHVSIPEALHPWLRRSISVSLILAACTYAISWILLLTTSPTSVRVAALILAAPVMVIHSERTRRTLDLLIFQHPVLPHPLNRSYALARVASAFALFGVLQTIVQDPGRTTGPATAMIIAVPLLIAGTALIRFGSFLREVTPPSCPNCFYPVADLPFPLTCPECARHMPSPADAVTTPLIKRPALTRTGIALFALGIIVWFAILIRPGGMLAAMPLPARLALAPTDSKAFATINTAALSTEERGRLITRILDAGAHGSTFRMYRQLAWLADELIAGNLTEQQARRVTRDAWSVAITTDRPLLANQNANITLDGRAPAHNPQKLTYLYATQGFEIEPDQSFARLDNFRAAFPAQQLAEPIRFGSDSSHIIHKPYLRIRPTQPGPVPVRATLIAFVLPANTPHTIVWNPDGSCTITPTPLDSHEIILETTLTVTP